MSFILFDKDCFTMRSQANCKRMRRLCQLVDRSTGPNLNLHRVTQSSEISCMGLYKNLECEKPQWWLIHGLKGLNSSRFRKSDVCQQELSRGIPRAANGATAAARSCPVYDGYDMWIGWDLASSTVTLYVVLAYSFLYSMDYGCTVRHFIANLVF